MVTRHLFFHTELFFPMKYFIILLFLTSFVIHTQCHKDPSAPTLGAQIQGTWLMLSYLENGEEWVDSGDKYTLSFKGFDGRQGRTEWAFLNSLGGLQQFNGQYRMNSDGDHIMQIIWDNDTKMGGFDDITFNTTVTADTLKLDAIDIGNNYHKIIAVRQ